MKSNYNDEGAECPDWRKVLAIYMQATGSEAVMFDRNFQLFAPQGNTGVEQNICRHCSGSSAQNGAADSGIAEGGTMCRALHREAMIEAGCQGYPRIYRCELGLAFWVSPIFDEKTLCGSLRGSGCVIGGADTSALAEKYSSSGCQAVGPEEFSRRVCALPQIDEEKLKSLAELLFMCAESLSSGSERHRETLRLRSDQMDSISALIDELKANHGDGSAPPVYPLEIENRLIASLQRGEKLETEKLLNELLAALVFYRAENFRLIQLGAVELAVLLARAEANTGGIATEDNSRFVRQIQDAKTIRELSGTLHHMADTIAASIALFQGIPHASAMRRADRFIRKNLSRKISLREIAGEAGLSAPYFSTIFKEEMGENLSRYINRLRVEKACRLLLETDRSLSDIACDCCFDDQSWFSKMFKSFTGLSPGRYRSQGGN
ncbi:MAG: helix-turn-helix domain-containing protein [Treponema sp.]|nr:helix-turn-helix domain-containing protein [Treponema sp.]